MRKKIVIGLVLALLAGVSAEKLPAQAQTPRLFVKFNGAAVSSSAGDFGDFVDKNEGIGRDVARNVSTRSFFRGVGGEIGLEMKKHSVGIGVAYFERYLDTGFMPGAGFEPVTLTRHSFSAVPFFLFIRYKLVNGSFFKAALTLGEGVYLATYQEKTAGTVLLKSRKANLGFHGGVSMDLHIFQFLAVFVDAGYRLVSFKNMVGKDYQTPGAPVEGDLYYRANGADGQYGFFIKIPKTDVPGSRPAVLNLNGFALNAGMKIIF